MKFFLFTILWFSVLQVNMLHAQKETKSDKILTKLSKKIKGLKTFYVEYSASVKNEDLGQNDSYTGKGWVKNNKYFATYGDNTLISNGLKTWSIIGKDKEVYESNNSDEEESVNPKKLMTLWESGFKNKFIKSDKIGNDAVDVIELYPKIPEKSNYTTITVYIGSASNELKKAVMKTTDGTVMTYSVTKFTSNPEVKDTKFTFDKKNYPGYKVIKN